MLAKSKNMTISEAQYIHFIGIGGIGTSSLAQILHKKGKIISGSDTVPSDLTRSLKLSGIKIFLNHNETNINTLHQLVIYSPAIPKSNEELLKAKKLKIKCLSYPEALGELTKDYYTIAIAGTHGKSTTTAMISLIAVNASMDPTVVIGTKIREFKNQNYRVGNSNYLIIEACEYKESFLHFHPNILIITNIEAEHLDYYKNLKNYKNAFKKLVGKIPIDGAVIIDSNDKNSKEVVKGAKTQIIQCEKLSATIKTGVIGKFNQKNAQFALIAATLLNIPNNIIKKTLKSYKGSWRRLHYKTKKNYKCKFIDDYGHHPTEIQETLAAIREQYPDKKILCVFQPHQYSRTYLLLKDFGQSFSAVDEIIIPNIYKVRDSKKDVKRISPEKLVKEIKKHNKKVKYSDGLQKTAEFIKKNHSKYDLIVTMGAGDIDSIYKMI